MSCFPLRYNWASTKDTFTFIGWNFLPVKVTYSSFGYKNLARQVSPNKEQILYTATSKWLNYENRSLRMWMILEAISKCKFRMDHRAPTLIAGNPLHFLLLKFRLQLHRPLLFLLSTTNHNLPTINLFSVVFLNRLLQENQISSHHACKTNSTPKNLNKTSLRRK